MSSIDATMSVLERSLDLYMRKHEVHASNIANANVPGFKAKSMDFRERLKEVLDSTPKDQPRLAHERQLSDAVQQMAPDIYEDPTLPVNGVGNTVEMEREQTEIAKNTIAFQTAIQLVNKKLALQKYVVGEGAR